MKNAVRLRPLEDWICVQQLTADEVKEIERDKSADKVGPRGKETASMIIFVEKAARAMGEEPSFYRWCRVLSVHEGYDDVKVGDVVFCNVISGSQGANDQFSSIDGVKFIQMPTKDVMAVLE